MSRDDEALEIVFDSIYRSERTRQDMVDAAEKRDFERVSRIVSGILGNRKVDNLYNLIDKVIDQFK